MGNLLHTAIPKLNKNASPRDFPKLLLKLTGFVMLSATYSNIFPKVNVIKTKLENSFSQVPNRIYKDTSLKGNDLKILFIMMSKPSKWEFNIKSLSRESGLGVDTVYRKIKTLEKSGYVKRFWERKKGGKFGKVVTYVSWDKRLLPGVELNPSIVPESAPFNDFTYKEKSSTYKHIESSNKYIKEKDKDLKGGVEIAPPLPPSSNNFFYEKLDSSCNSNSDIVNLPCVSYHSPTPDSKAFDRMPKLHGAPASISTILEDSINRHNEPYIEGKVSLHQNNVNVSLNEEIRAIEAKEIEEALSATIYKQLNCVIPVSDLYSNIKEHGIRNVVDTANLMVVRKIWEKNDPISYFSKALNRGWAKDMSANKGTFKFKSGLYGQPKDEHRMFGAGAVNTSLEQPFVRGVKASSSSSSEVQKLDCPILESNNYLTDEESSKWWSELDVPTKKGMLLMAQKKQPFFDVLLKVQNIDPISEEFYLDPNNKWAFNMLMQLIGKKRERGPLNA